MRLILLIWFTFVQVIKNKINRYPHLYCLVASNGKKKGKR